MKHCANGHEVFDWNMDAGSDLCRPCVARKAKTRELFPGISTTVNAPYVSPTEPYEPDGRSLAEVAAECAMLKPRQYPREWRVV
jgi:hypothetical protein